MKKQLFLVAAIGVAGMALTSCGGASAPKGNYEKFCGTVSQHTELQAYATLRAVRNALDGKTVEDGTFWTYGYSVADDAGGKLASNKWKISDDNKNFFALNEAITAKNIEGFDAKAVDPGVKQLTREKKKVWISLYSNTDNFLNETYKPLVEKYAVLLNLELKWVIGENDESKIVEQFTDLDNYDAYCINMVNFNSYQSYASKITGDNLHKPLIWFNRQPSDAAAYNVTDKTFYVGFDAIQGGDAQGQMIVDFIKEYADTIDIFGAKDKDGKDVGDGVIKYYLCVGQNAHNDSVARTKGIRRALGTLKNDSAEPDVKQEGSVTANNGKTYKIIEAKAKEMRDDHGPWNENVASEATDAWHTADPRECELVISNNDGMGMAVYNKWAKAAGIPVFGYDANKAATDAIK